MAGQSNAAPEGPKLINRIAGFYTWQNRRAHDMWPRARSAVGGRADLEYRLDHEGEQQRGASAAA